MQILNKRLKIKLYVVVCAETGNLEHYQYYKLNGYNIYYNNSHINKSDGVVIYIKKDVTQTTNVIELGKLKILNTIINLKTIAIWKSHLCTDHMICIIQSLY